MKRKILLFFLCFFCVEIAFSQTLDLQAYENNQAKYWLYRERLKKYFMTYVGLGPTASLPASERLYGDTQYGRTLKWGDATINLAEYISVLAMEIQLLWRAGYTYEDMRGTIEELYFAMSAFNRLDLVAETHYGYPVQLLNGFFVRDDINTQYPDPNSNIISPTKIILNLSLNPFVTISNSFPVEMLIDFVKVYELKKDCDDFINSTTYDFASYNNIEKNFIKIGENGGNNSLSIGEDIKLRASQFIEFSGDFNVPIGSSLYADANKDCSIDLGIECTQKFNPCVYDFTNYNNSIKNLIELGGNGCIHSIIPSSNNISLDATEQILLNPGVTMTPIQGKSIEAKIVSCN